MIDKILYQWEYKDGQIVWKVQPRTKTSQVGDPVSFVEKPSRHRIVSVWFEGKTHKLQYARVVWLLVHGSFPENEIDHVDHDPTNNDIANLREADRSQNLWNKRLSSSGGVYKHGPSWRVELSVRSQRHRVGGFPDKKSAVAYRKKMAQELQGEFYNPKSYEQVSL